MRSLQSLRSISSWPVGAAAAGVVVRGLGDGSGAASAAVARGHEGPVDRPFYWASVTKLCTALTVLVAVEEKTLFLDQPAGPHGSTVAHLLAHASGLSPGGGAVLARPGRRRIYSNAGFELLGELVAEHSRIAFTDYLREAVLDPLGMRGARLAPDGSPAADMYGTLGDLLALGAELLRPTLVAPETLAAATSVAFPGLPGVLPGLGFHNPCDWGLGFELRDGKTPHWTGRRNSPATFGHFGRSGSFLWVDPVAGVACAGLSDREFGPWAAAAWPQLADAVLEELGAPEPGAQPLPVEDSSQVEAAGARR